MCPKPCFWHTYKVSVWNSHDKFDFLHCLFSMIISRARTTLVKQPPVLFNEPEYIFPTFISCLHTDMHFVAICFSATVCLQYVCCVFGVHLFYVVYWVTIRHCCCCCRCCADPRFPQPIDFPPLISYPLIAVFAGSSFRGWGSSLTFSILSVRLNPGFTEGFESVRDGISMELPSFLNKSLIWFPPLFTVVDITRGWNDIAMIITVTSWWPRWCLKSPASRLYTQLFIQGKIKENIKTLRHWPLCGEFAKGQ